MSSLLRSISLASSVDEQLDTYLSKLTIVNSSYGLMMYVVGSK
jgi:hypothetical protein